MTTAPSRPAHERRRELAAILKHEATRTHREFTGHFNHCLFCRPERLCVSGQRYWDDADAAGARCSAYDEGRPR